MDQSPGAWSARPARHARMRRESEPLAHRTGGDVLVNCRLPFLTSGRRGPGRSPGRFFLTHFNEILKQILRTTRPTAPRWKAHVQICADPSPRSAREARRRARRAGRASWVCGSAPKSSVAAPGYRVRAGARGLGLGLGFGLPEHRGVARREACGRAFRPGRVRIEGLEVSGLVKC